MKRLAGLLPVRAVQRFLTAQGPNWATIVAWNLFFAFLPMAFLVISVVGLVLQDPAANRTIEAQVVAAFPSCHAGVPSSCPILGALDNFRTSPGTFAAVGILGLIWSGASLFSAIEQGLDALYAVRTRGFVRQKLMSIGMVVLFTLMVVPLVASGALLSLLRSIPALPGVIRSGPVSLLLQVVAGALDASALFAVIFYVVPNRRQRMRHILPGALLTGSLFEILTLVFPLYFGLVTHTPQWGQTFGLVFVLLFYFFLIGQLLMLGGAVNAEVEGLPRPPAGGVTKLSQSGNAVASPS
ncbi:MAG: YihY/virulence factor BrkB family protein [Candidatus Dormibacteria bacterium]